MGSRSTFPISLLLALSWALAAACRGVSPEPVPPPPAPEAPPEPRAAPPAESDSRPRFRRKPEPERVARAEAPPDAERVPPVFAGPREPADYPRPAEDAAGAAIRDELASESSVESPLEPQAEPGPGFLVAGRIHGLPVCDPEGAVVGYLEDWALIAETGRLAVALLSPPGVGDWAAGLRPLPVGTLAWDPAEPAADSTAGACWLTTSELGPVEEPERVRSIPAATGQDDLFADLFARQETVTAEGVVQSVSEGSVSGAPRSLLIEVIDGLNHYHRVLLAPRDVLEEAGIAVAEKDEVVVEGVRARDESGAMIVAGYLRSGTTQLTLRGENGAPAWAQEAGLGPEEAPDEAEPGAAGGEWLYASEVVGRPVSSRDGALGVVADLAFVPRRGILLFALLEAVDEPDGGLLVVPWRCLSISPETGELVWSRSAQELEALPRLDAEGAQAGDPLFLRDVVRAAAECGAPREPEVPEVPLESPGLPPEESPGLQPEEPSAGG